MGSPDKGGLTVLETKTMMPLCNPTTQQQLHYYYKPTTLKVPAQGESYHMYDVFYGCSWPGN